MDAESIVEETGVFSLCRQNWNCFYTATKYLHMLRRPLNSTASSLTMCDGHTRILTSVFLSKSHLFPKSYFHSLTATSYRAQSLPEALLFAHHGASDNSHDHR
jgi:hypothetical protein